MSKFFRCVLVLGMICFVIPFHTQSKPKSKSKFNNSASNWKKNRTEFYATLGATSFLGELGGRNEIGSDFIYDFELNQTRWGATIGVRRFLTKNIALRGNVMFGFLAGNDNLTEEAFRQKRNLHFRSFVVEVSGIAEYNFRTGNFSQRNSFRGIKGRRTANKEMFYSVFAGVGLLKFNPKGRYKEQWYDLRNFGTEGQNLGNSSAKYQLYTIVIPVGINVRKAISRRINLSLELSHRFTFSDYIDDVSTVYFNNEAIEEFQGEAAAYFADPSFDYLIRDGEEVLTDNTQPGMQRGDPNDNDSYMMLSLGANYKLNTFKFKRRKRSANNRRRGKRLVF